MGLRELIWECVDWVHIAQDRGHWWAIVNTVMNHRFYKMRLSSLFERLLASQEGLCFMECSAAVSDQFCR
jgi:hypothetical protein